MYEAIEHWVQYKQEKDRKAMKMTSFLIKLQKEKALKEMDEFLAKLRKKNGQSKSILS